LKLWKTGKMKKDYLIIVFIIIILLYIWIFSNPALYLEFIKIIQKLR